MYRESGSEDRSILVVANDSTITGIDRATGQVRWQQAITTEILGIQARYGGAVELAIHGGRVFAALRDRIVCLDYLSGAKIGEVRLGSVARRPTFVIDGDRIFVATSRAIECYTLDGQRVWSASRHADLDGSALGFPGNIRQGDDVGR